MRKDVLLTQEFMDFLELNRPSAFYWLRKKHIETGLLSVTGNRFKLEMPELLCDDWLDAVHTNDAPDFDQQVDSCLPVIVSDTDNPGVIKRYFKEV